MAKATINGIEIAFTDEGSGTPIVFIHGFPLNRTMWDDQVRGLSSQARCIAIDLRAHGESEAAIWLSSVDTYAAEVIGLLDHLGIDKAVICGLSMGGYVTFAIWRNYRERVLALVLADTRAPADSAEGKQGRYNTALTAQRQGQAAVVSGLLPRLITEASMEKPELVSKAKGIMESTSLAGFASDLMTMAERPDSVETLASINVPTLVVVGESDALTPLADSQLMAEKIPNARLEVIPAAGHLSNMEDPESFNRVVGAFLKGI